MLAVGAGAFGVLALTSPDGASSPEAAVEALIDAVADEDAIGMLEALDPTERDILIPAVEDTKEEATRVEVAADDLDLRKVRGLDIEIDGVQLATEPLGDGVTAVHVTSGTISSIADLDRLPLGATVRDLVERRRAEEGLGDPTPDDRADLTGLTLVAVHRDGAWHVSLLYSLGELIRAELDPVPPVDLAHPIPAVGAPDPETAVRDAVAAAVALDVERLIELTPSTEMRALHEYGPMLVAEVERDRADHRPLQVSNLGLITADGPDDTRVVTATSFTVRDASEHGSTVWEYDGECTTVTESYEWRPNDGYEYTNRTCDGDLPSAAMALLPAPFGASAGDLRVVTEEHDGRWYISPTHTVLESTVGSFRDFEVEEFERSLRAWSGEWWVAEPDGFWAACGVDRPGLDASRAEGDAAWQACYEQLPDDYGGAGMAGRMWVSESPAAAPCAGIPDDADHAACMLGETGYRDDPALPPPHPTLPVPLPVPDSTTPG